MLEDFNRMVTMGGSEEPRQSRIIVGPWTHESVSKFDDVDFGPQADFMQQIKAMLSWYNFWLRDDGAEMPSDSPVTIFVMGGNEWREEAEWPLARTQFTKYYLHSNGNANTSGGDGILSPELPGEEPPDHFTYDPANPVPSLGGTSIYGNATPGPRDQRQIEMRPDVLVYTTPPLDEEIEIIGPVSAIIYASSSAVDTDFSVKLVDVYPDGKAINLRSGMVRARYRDSFTEPAFLEENEIYEFEIPVGATANLFKKDHCIRIEVSSSHFPEFGRNLNTGADIASDREMVTAKQTIFHDQDNPSYVLLPLIPSDT
jgi:putative CocE/NonD family hydrolase